MSPFLRGVLYGMGIMVAFALGYGIKGLPPMKLVVERPTQEVAATPPTKEIAVSAEPAKHPLTIDFPEPPIFRAEAIDPNDPHLQGIRTQLGLDTSSVKPNDVFLEVLRGVEMGPMPREVN